MTGLKTWYCIKILVLGWTMLKNVSAVGLSGIPNFWETFHFHLEIINFYIFQPDLTVCVVNAKNSITKMM